MIRGHLSDDELIEVLYGLGDGEVHLKGCGGCTERLGAMRRARAEHAAVSGISGRMLAAQRQSILERLPSSGSYAPRWVPAAAAAAALLAAGLYLYQPSRVPAPAPTKSEGDAALFTDVYSMEQDVEPRAAAPIRAMFQEASFQSASPAKERQDQ